MGHNFSLLKYRQYSDFFPNSIVQKGVLKNKNKTKQKKLKSNVTVEKPDKHLLSQMTSQHKLINHVDSMYS